MVVKKTCECTSVGESALFNDKSYGVICGGKQPCGIADTVLVDEVGGRRVGALVKCVGDIFVVGADETCKRVAVGLGVGVDGGVFHQLKQTIV